MPNNTPTKASILTTLHAIQNAALAVQEELNEDLPKEWIAENGVTFRDVQEGMVFIQRSWHALIVSVSSRSNPPIIADRMVELAGALLKASMDFRGMHNGTPVPPERADYTILHRMIAKAAAAADELEDTDDSDLD